jgi:mRNA interferase MazF
MAHQAYLPDRGDLVHMNFQPSAGREQTGPRYAIILSPKKYNRASGLAVCCPITSHVKGYPFEVPVDGQHVRGVVLVDHVRSVDFRERNMSFKEHASREVLEGVVSLALELLDPQQA